jgi:hypothetical protein
MGYFGHRRPRKTGESPQPLHQHVVPLARALEVSAPALQLWEVWETTSHAPLFTGGTMDAWPAWALDVLGIGSSEWPLVLDWLKHQAEVSHG